MRLLNKFASKVLQNKGIVGDYSCDKHEDLDRHVQRMAAEGFKRDEAGWVPGPRLAHRPATVNHQRQRQATWMGDS